MKEKIKNKRMIMGLMAGIAFAIIIAIIVINQAPVVENKKEVSHTLSDTSTAKEDNTDKPEKDADPKESKSNITQETNQKDIAQKEKKPDDTQEKNSSTIKNSDYVKIKDYIPSMYIDLRYATANNFTGQVIYDFKDAYLRYGAVKKLTKAQNELLNQGYSLKIWDAYRPFDAQKKLWQVVNNPRYVANPSNGPRSHNLGGTVDITIVKKNGEEIAMPTQFDDFSKKADRDYSEITNQEAVHNVKLLENTMFKYGFKGYQNEWWDYTDTVTYSYIDFQPK